MKNVFLLILFFNSTAFSQRLSQPTQFDTFINRPSIEWAAYANDTVRFEEINLNRLLITRLAKKSIRASLPVASGTKEANDLKFLSKISIDSFSLSTPLRDILFDSTGINTAKLNRELINIDTIISKLMSITQVLYIENRRLKTYIAWVSPRIVPITTSSGALLGINEYFSSCFNFRYNYAGAEKNKKLFLAQTKKMIRLDTVETENKLKELYGRNMIETLWPYILDSSITVFSIEKNKKLKPREIIEDLINNVKITVPVYDTLGNISAYTVPQMPLSPKVFTGVELVQDWYYDYTTNIVFNKIREAWLYAKKWTNDLPGKAPSPILKIVFN